jgi:peptidyl-prolyl cis-trans isomerase SurA
LFELMQDKIWEGAKNDSVGLQEFYNANKQKYVWTKRVEGSVARSTNAKHIKKVRKHWSRNKSNAAIAEALNTNNEQNVIFTNGEFEIGHSALPNTFEAVKGVSKVIQENSNYYVLNISAIKPESVKSFEEAKGQVIADYQVILESEWLDELRVKFDVVVHEDVLKKVNELISN